MILKFVSLTAKCYHKYMTNLLQANVLGLFFVKSLARLKI